MYMLSVGCLLLLTMMFAAVTAAFRLCPSLGRFLKSALIASIIVSVRFYYLILSRLAPTVMRLWKIDILTGLWRLAATTIFSLTLGGISISLLGWGVSPWVLLLLAAHGLLADLVWDEVLDDASLQLGVRQ